MSRVSPVPAASPVKPASPVPPVVDAGTRQRLAEQTVQLWSDPGVVDLAIGQPQDAILPVELLDNALARFAARPVGPGGSGYPWQYGHQRGDGILRVELADFLAPRYAIPVDPDLMYITNGNSQAIDQCCGVFTSPGDTVLVEEPSYHLAMQIFRDHHLRLVGVPVDEHGISIDALREALRRHRPSLLYIIPTAQNPTGATLPTQRRQALVELAAEHGFLVLADEVYHLLNYADEPGPEPMAAYLDSGVVLSLGTFSKILAPGLRLGWAQAARPLIERLESYGFVISGGGLNPVPAAVVPQLLADGSAAAYLERLRGIFRARVATMDADLRRCLPQAQWTVPTGGYFFWLRLDSAADVGGGAGAPVDTEAVLPLARALGAGFAPGVRFSTQDGLRDHLRLSFAYYGTDELTRAVEAIGRAFTG